MVDSMIKIGEESCPLQKVHPGIKLDKI